MAGVPATKGPEILSFSVYSIKRGEVSFQNGSGKLREIGDMAGGMAGRERGG